MATARPQNPDSVEGLTTAWFDQALRAEHGRVVRSNVLKVVHGTATKIHVALAFEKEGRLSERNVWVKTGLEEHSHRIGQDQVYAGEVYYYSNVAGRFSTKTPECLYAQFEPDTGRSVVIMADLLDQGAQFREPVEPLSVETTAKGLAMIAQYQAESWNHDFILTDPYLKRGGVLRSGAIEAWIFADENWAEQSQRPRFKAAPAALRNKDVWQNGYHAVLEKWWPSGPQCLSHGDAHAGQSYRLPNGEVRLLDWQCVMSASWGHDFAYFLTTSLSPADRRATEDDLLNDHLARLRDHGVKTPDFAAAKLIYRACTFYGASWALCKVEMQSEANCTAISERTMAAVTDLNSLEAVSENPPV